jgi:hypothetical protein
MTQSTATATSWSSGPAAPSASTPAPCLPKQKPSLQEKLDVHGVGLFSSGMFLLVIPLVLGRDAGWPLWTWFGATVK